jgi:hypothetical protein
MASLLKPLRFRFTDAQDIADYGERWYIYDESAITSMRARDLMPLEQELGLPLADVMNGVRQSSIMGDMAGAWLALKLDPEFGDKAPAFADFNPVVMLLKWSAVPAEEMEAGKEETSSGGQAELEPGGSPDMPPSAPVMLPVESATDDTFQTATVSLVSMPVSGSPTS